MVQRAGADASAAGAVLADVKAVAPGYPLRGAIMLVDANAAPAARRRRAFRRAAKRGPMRGSRRGSASRSAMRIAVGDATLKVGAIVQQEPEVASGLLAIGPRLLINLDDVPATNLLQPGNRATYRLLVADLSERDRARSLSRRGCRPS